MIGGSPSIKRRRHCVLVNSQLIGKSAKSVLEGLKSHQGGGQTKFEPKWKRLPSLRIRFHSCAQSLWTVWVTLHFFHNDRLPVTAGLEAPLIYAGALPSFRRTKDVPMHRAHSQHVNFWHHPAESNKIFPCSCFIRTHTHIYKIDRLTFSNASHQDMLLPTMYWMHDSP